jgi:hypothetical protein
MSKRSISTNSKQQPWFAASQMDGLLMNTRILADDEAAAID